MGDNVQADSQFTVANRAQGRILRPFPGFENVYQGVAGDVPVAFPGTLDDDAGELGFSPYLLKGTPCPLGAKTVVYIPAITQGLEPVVAVDYGYLLVWRLRNLGDQTRDFEKQRANPRGYHLTKESFAAQDTLLAPAEPDRFLIPAVIETVVYQQPEVGPFASARGLGVGNLRGELIAVPGDNFSFGVTAGLPLLAPGAAPPFANAYPPSGIATTPLGLFQQGVADPAVVSSAPLPLFRPYFTVAKGDDLVIIAARRPLDEIPAVPVWDFTDEDEGFSNLYGVNSAGPTHPPFENLGIYVMFGSSPT